MRHIPHPESDVIGNILTSLGIEHQEYHNVYYAELLDEVVRISWQFSLMTKGFRYCYRIWIPQEPGGLGIETSNGEDLRIILKGLKENGVIPDMDKSLQETTP